MDDQDPKNREDIDPEAGQGERPGEGSFWDEISGSAEAYADEHSIGVALGSLGVGLAVGLLLGLLISRD